jgi:hypothetical protein
MRGSLPNERGKIRLKKAIVADGYADRIIRSGGVHDPMQPLITETSADNSESDIRSPLEQTGPTMVCTTG